MAPLCSLEDNHPTIPEKREAERYLSFWEEGKWSLFMFPSSTALVMRSLEMNQALGNECRQQRALAVKWMCVHVKKKRRGGGGGGAPAGILSGIVMKEKLKRQQTCAHMSTGCLLRQVTATSWNNMKAWWDEHAQTSLSLSLCILILSPRLHCDTQLLNFLLSGVTVKFKLNTRNHSYHVHVPSELSVHAAVMK